MWLSSCLAYNSYQETSSSLSLILLTLYPPPYHLFSKHIVKNRWLCAVGKSGKGQIEKKKKKIIFLPNAKVNSEQYLVKCLS